MGLVALPLQIKRDELIGILSSNFPEWLLVDMACITQSIVVVSIHDKYPLGVINYIEDICKLRVIVCGSLLDCLNALLAAEQSTTTNNLSSNPAIAFNENSKKALSLEYLVCMYWPEDMTEMQWT